MLCTAHATSAGSQACLSGGGDDVASMNTTCMNEHKPLPTSKRSVAHEAGKGWLWRDSCRASSTGGHGRGIRWRKQGRERRGRAGRKEVSVVAVRGHGLVRYDRGVPVDANDQIAAQPNFFNVIKRSWVARLINLACAKPISSALTTAGAGSPWCRLYHTQGM